ncbi:hypothetical protein D5S17_01660 [Pseudonocardiaceae bacterium YIM PH 21723]|nr:hypothetical protein D5S17_01660 [Pseudonocardiaceae bacterium YIM PH 21723]
MGKLSLARVGPYLDTVRRVVGEWSDPRARLLRKRRAARQHVITWSMFSVPSGIATFFVGTEPTLEFSEFALGGFSALTAAAAVSAGLYLRELHRRPLPAAPRPRPGSGSLAVAPLRRLDEAERGLGRALELLTDTLPTDSITSARDSADRSAVALRGLADRLIAVEGARDVCPPAQRGPLVDAVRRLRAQLDEGIDSYASLVAAAGRALAAGTRHAEPLELREATDHLAGLAIALTELSGSS